MDWALLAVGLTTLVLGANALFPARSLPLLAVSFLAQWLVAELAPFVLAASAVGVGFLMAFGGAHGWVGWTGFGAACAGWALLGAELALAWRARAACAHGLAAAGLGPPRPDPGAWHRLLTPFWLGDRRVERIPDLRYAPGAGRRHLADVYRRRGGVVDAPVLLQVHGGGWMIGTKRQQGRPLMNRMAAAGWVCVAINYRLAPRAPMPAQLEDVKRALSWIRAHIRDHGGDPRRIVVTGGSSGGHLAAMAALTANDPQFQPGFEAADTSVLAAVLLYPPTDLVALFGRRRGVARGIAHRSATLIFGASPATDPDGLHRWSPVALVRPGLVPFCVVHGTKDNLVPVAQSRAFVEHLRAVPGQRVLSIELPGAPHAFDVFHSLRTEAAIAAIHRFCEGFCDGLRD